MAAEDTYPGVRPALEELLLGERPDLTVAEAAEQLGVQPQALTEVWRALGLAQPGDQRVLGRADVEALSGLLSLVQSGALTHDTALHMARAIGRATTPLSSWMSEIVAGDVEAHGETVDRWRSAGALGEAALPVLSALLDRTWRRHLLGAADRFAGAQPNRPRLLVSEQTVGFADLVASTPIAQSVGQHDWAVRATRFEDLAADVFADTSARLVKTLGDEVMFVTTDRLDGVETALRLLEAVADEPSIPSLSVGVATGEVALRAGDVYGTTVNLAARLVGMAAPGELLADDVTAKSLVSDARYDVAVRAPRPARGFGTITPLRVTRSSR